jgi:hypothetical protein
LHLWQEDGTFNTITIADLAGYPTRDRTSSSSSAFLSAYKEPNLDLNQSGANQLMFVFKEMFETAQSKPAIKSKLAKEIAQLVSQGHSKISFL